MFIVTKRIVGEFDITLVCFTENKFDAEAYVTKCLEPFANIDYKQIDDDNERECLDYIKGFGIREDFKSFIASGLCGYLYPATAFLKSCYRSDEALKERIPNFKVVTFKPSYKIHEVQHLNDICNT